MAPISAQVSLYPLRQAALSPAIEEALRVFRRRGLHVQPGAMSTQVGGDADAVFAALQEAFCGAVAHGQTVMIVTLSNACPVVSESSGPLHGPEPGGRDWLSREGGDAEEGRAETESGTRGPKGVESP